jgi:hypothetical protein
METGVEIEDGDEVGIEVGVGIGIEALGVLMLTKICKIEV